MPEVYTTDEAYSAAEVDKLVASLQKDMRQQMALVLEIKNSLQNEIKELQARITLKEVEEKTALAALRVNPWQAYKQDHMKKETSTDASRHQD